MLRIISPVLFLASASAQPLPSAPQQSCMVGFSTLQFDPWNYDAYPTYFDDQSVYTLAQAGDFTGPRDIEEYIRFADPDRPYIQSRHIPWSRQSFKGLDSSGHCIFVVKVATRYATSPPAFPARFTTAVMIRIHFDSTRSKIRHFWAYYPLGFLSFVFNSLLNTDSTREFICSTMQACNETWLLNGFTDVGHCAAAMKALPTTQGDQLHFDGDSQGCRAVHAVLASQNAAHCPHISLARQADKKGLFKCQTSKNKDVLASFDEDDLRAFRDFGRSIGLDDSMIRVETCCTVDAECPAHSSCTSGICQLGSATTTPTSTSAPSDTAPWLSSASTPISCGSLAVPVPAAPKNLKSSPSIGIEGPTVAIVGGGAAGLLSARELVAMGYKVTVYEAAGRVGGVSTTHRDSDGRAYDLSTVFMASGDLYGEDLSECMSTLVDEAGLSESVREFWGPTTQWENFPIPMKTPLLPTSMKDALQVGKGQEVIDEIITIIRIFDDVVRSPTPGIASTRDFAVRGESFKAWSKRMKVSIPGDLFITLTDALMAGPAERSYAPYVLNQRARLGPAVLANYVLGVAGKMREHGQTPDLKGLRDTPRSFQALVRRGVHPSWLTFEDRIGFEDFWSGLAESLPLDALFVNAPVEALDVIDGGVRVRTTGVPVQVFDFVMLAVPPYYAHRLLNASTGLPSELVAARDAFAAVPRGDHGSITVAVRAASGPIDGSGALIVEMDPSYVIDGRPVVLAKLYADSDVYTMGVYITQSCASLNLVAAATEAVGQIESKLYPRMAVEQIIAVKCFDDWPYRPALEQIDTGFFDVLEAAQGKAGIFLTGELHAGAGIPAIAQYVAATVSQQFQSMRGSRKSACRVQSNEDDVAKGPLDYLSDDGFRWAYTFIVWIVVIFTGFGSEVVIGRYMFKDTEGKEAPQQQQRGWKQLLGLVHKRRDRGPATPRSEKRQREIRKLSQFLIVAEFSFPVLVLTAIGLGGMRSYSALPFLVAGLWKLGTPETYTWMASSIFAEEKLRSTQTVSDKIAAWSNAFGFLLHHSATAWAVCCLVTGREKMNRAYLTTMLPLVIQHVAGISRHSRFHIAYTVSMLSIEAFWEWEVFYWLQDPDFATLNIRCICWTMLTAHWLYLTAAAADMYRHLASRYTWVPSEPASLNRPERPSGSSIRSVTIRRYLQAASYPVFGGRNTTAGRSTTAAQGTPAMSDISFTPRLVSAQVGGHTEPLAPPEELSSMSDISFTPQLVSAQVGGHTEPLAPPEELSSMSDISARGGMGYTYPGS